MKLLIFLLSLCVTSLEAANITNWGAQLPTAVPASGDVILMQKGGVTYYFTPNQLATSLSTNALLTTGLSNGVFAIIIANDTITSNALVTFSIGGLSNKVGNLIGQATNLTMWGGATNQGSLYVIGSGSRLGIGTNGPSTVLDAHGPISTFGYRALLVPPQSVLPSNHADPLSAQLTFTFIITSNYNLFVGNGGQKTTNTIGVLDPVDPLPFESNGSMNGVWNTFVGMNAGLQNVSGNENTFVGTAAGQQNINGDQNTFIGNMAGISNTNGYHNTFVGTSAGQNNWSGWFNTRIGCDNGIFANGTENTSVGASSGGYDLGSQNSWFGAGVGGANTVGYQNSGLGAAALNGNVAGYRNTAVGVQSLGIGGNLTNDTAVGYNSLLYATGPYNTAMGTEAGYNPDNNIAQYRITSDEHITLLGYGATKNNAVKITNGTAVGAGAHVLTNNQVVIGNDNVTTTLLKGAVGIGTTNPGTFNGVTFPTVGLHMKGLNGYALVESSSGGLGGILLSDASQSADSRLWSINLNDTAGGLSIGTLNDAGATTQRAIFDRSGNLGLGTATPTGRLDVRSLLNVANSDVVANTTGTMVQIGNFGASSGNTFGAIHVLNNGGATVGDLALNQYGGNVGIGTGSPLGRLHVIGGIVQTNGGIWQTWSLAAPSAPATRGAVYWNDGTNICAVFRNAAGALSTNKLSMTAWP